jgi:valyl-tRNA synthetase
MRPQAHDIIRTWAFDTIVKTWMHHGIAPWKDIVISGHVLSDAKEKISKKDGTAMDPLLLLQKYPADAIRYWTASGKLGHDISFSEEQLNVGQKLITKLWNAFRFAEPHLQEFNKTSTPPTEIGAINKWLLHTLSTFFTQYHNYFEQQEAGLALNIIEHFFWNDFCDNYIELIKNQLFNPQEYDAKEVYATRWTLYHAGLRILQLYAPYMPHVTETLYQELYKIHENVASLHQTHYQDVQISYIFESESYIMNRIIALTTQVRKLKSEQQLSLKTALATMHVFAEDSTLCDALKKHDQLIRGVTQATEIIYETLHNQTAQLIKINDVWHAHVLVK